MIKSEVGTMNLGSSIFTDSSKVVLLLWIYFVICVCLCHTVMSVSCNLVVTCRESADLLALLCVIFLVFCHFHISCPVSSVVLDCIEY